ncbi:ligase-associated DNA damage response endonuclease PdeM [Alteromonas ponticola]|uniref:Ligase-associated DNA damage response endonuclease PdeM n=1 Tax=Alteromonas aquimaris TaxID=2998417 RepID=A0ABT3P8V3_9ALTE|nr:ligase-associated DNA damage response endonuclease PdeM [Alteromonas aquimaris]MCW8109195.1 ligase-associated DNA damage response endonuclease PdeM [Alteromonas aquimaris]
MAVTADWLYDAIAKRQGVLVKLANISWLLHAEGVAFCPAHDTLLVSDLHLEKASYLARSGNPLTPLDTYATLQRLTKLIALFKPAKVICVGDSFHDVGAFTRLSSGDRAELSRMVEMPTEWVWILGNHDPDLPADIPGKKRKQTIVGNIRIVHEPEQDAAYQVVGHFHPKGKVSVNRHRLRGKCYVLTENLLIMPSFGQYTGGLDVSDAAITRHAPKAGRQCFLMYEGAIYTLNERTRKT